MKWLLIALGALVVLYVLNQRSSAGVSGPSSKGLFAGGSGASGVSGVINSLSNLTNSVGKFFTKGDNNSSSAPDRYYDESTGKYFGPAISF